MDIKTQLENYVFPTTTETFISFQENCINRRLDDFEVKFSAVAVDLMNLSYEEGLEERKHTITLGDIKQFMRDKHGEYNEKLNGIWEFVCWWCNRAYRAGKVVAQNA